MCTQWVLGTAFKDVCAYSMRMLHSARMFFFVRNAWLNATRRRMACPVPRRKPSPAVACCIDARAPQATAAIGLRPKARKQPFCRARACTTAARHQQDTGAGVPKLQLAAVIRPETPAKHSTSHRTKAALRPSAASPGEPCLRFAKAHARSARSALRPPGRSRLARLWSHSATSTGAVSSTHVWSSWSLVVIRICAGTALTPPHLHRD